MAQQAQFTLDLGRRVADAPAMPAWEKDDQFGKVRETAGRWRRVPLARLGACVSLLLSD
ncbi:hypothetical protein [Massilia orientalis]|jgi:hypothetical protein|uniref:hypothetical protein n=1 Tax=Massilia orientalis TaxID=3050128 RepID=UPI0037DCC697